MGNLQSSVNAALGTATKIEKLYKTLGQIEKQINELPSWVQQQEAEASAIHEEQMARINKPGATSGEKIYIPEDLSQDPSQIGPMDYTPAAFGADGFYLHDPALAEKVKEAKETSAKRRAELSKPTAEELGISNNPEDYVDADTDPAVIDAIENYYKKNVRFYGDPELYKMEPGFLTKDIYDKAIRDAYAEGVHHNPYWKPIPRGWLRNEKLAQVPEGWREQYLKAEENYYRSHNPWEQRYREKEAGQTASQTTQETINNKYTTTNRWKKRINDLKGGKE